MRIESVPWADPRALLLRDEMDAEMTARYAGRHDDDPDFPAKADAAFAVEPDDIAVVMLAIADDEEPVAHAALRRLGDRFEIKKVVVRPSHRGTGLGKRILASVEDAARDLGAASVLLQTGDRQPEAIAMYERVCYRRIPVFEPYLPITNSLCFEKSLTPID